VGIAEHIEKTGDAIERQIEPLGMQSHEFVDLLCCLTHRGLASGYQFGTPPAYRLSGARRQSDCAAIHVVRRRNRLLRQDLQETRQRFRNIVTFDDHIDHTMLQQVFGGLEAFG